MSQILQARYVGQAPDASGHPLAPPELVYQVERTPRRRRPPLHLKLLAFGSLGGWAYLIFRWIEFYANGGHY